MMHHEDLPLAGHTALVTGVSRRRGIGFSVAAEEVTSMTAFGIAAHAAGETASPGTSRDRASIEDIVWARA